jgi:hypothetical protein
VADVARTIDGDRTAAIIAWMSTGSADGDINSGTEGRQQRRTWWGACIPVRERIGQPKEPYPSARAI